MECGSEQTYALIGKVLREGDAASREALCDAVYADGAWYLTWLSGNLQEADREDILQEAVMNVLRGLPRFYEVSADKSEAERNGYLKTVVRNEWLDFLRRRKRRAEAQEKAAALAGAARSGRPAVRSDDGLSEEGDVPYEEDFAPRVENREAFFAALKDAFSIGTTPDKLMAFVFNRLLGRLSGRNGSPRSIIARFGGKPLTFMYEEMTADLWDVLRTGLPEEVFGGLRDKVYGEYAGSVFSMTTHQIADSSRWIVKKMQNSGNPFAQNGALRGR